MRRLFALLFTVLAWWGGPGLAALPPLPPAPQRWVTDPKGYLSPETQELLDLRLQGYERTTGHQVLVWIGESTEGQPLEDWAVRTFEAWKVGRKGTDDGLALFILARDRKLRIEVGYGLEGQMPDALASRIIRESIVPRLGAGDWDGAVRAGVDGILATLGGESPQEGMAPAEPVERSSLGLGEMILFGILAAAFILLLITHPSLAIGLLFSILSGGRSSSGGGGWSGGGRWSGGGGRSGGGGASGSW